MGLACEQSSYYHDHTLPEMHWEREFLRKTIQTGSSREFSEEFMRSEKHVRHHSYLMCNEANFLLGGIKQQFNETMYNFHFHRQTIYIVH